MASFNKCIYSTQGKLVCENNNKNKDPMILEKFVNTIPNQLGSDCSVLNTKLNGIISGYNGGSGGLNCTTSTANNGNNCSFTFNCTST